MANFTFPVRVYHEDVDTLGIVYYANYLRFMERARTEWLRTLDIDQGRLREESNVVFTVSSADIRFSRPAKFNDELLVSVRMRRLGRASMELEQTVERETGEIVCAADIKIACVDQMSHRPRRIPPRLLKELKTSDD